MASSSSSVLDVFRDNLYASTQLFRQRLKHYSTITLDTEFPGFLRKTPRLASYDHRYADLRYNVGNTRPIQVGFTLSDDGGNIGGTWQFNLSDFNPHTDPCAVDSVDLLSSSGIDFQKNMAEGIPGSTFGEWLAGIIVDYRERLRWVTFHGMYDLAYLVALLTGGRPLPVNADGFLESLRKLFGRRVYDLKVVAEECGLGKGIGLHRLAAAIEVERSAGEAHQAGSDSLLTALVLRKLRKMGIRVELFQGLLIGIQGRVAAVDGQRLITIWRPHPATNCVRVCPPVVYYGLPPRPAMGYAGAGFGWMG